MSKQIGEFKVIDNLKINDFFFILTLQYSKKLPEILPGQFVEVLVPDSNVLLRRPFSVFDVDYQKNQIRILIKIKGKGTLSLYNLENEQNINLIFPLGNSFTLPKSGKSLLVGGGVGIAPMYLLSKYLKKNNSDFDLLYGARDKYELIEIDSFAELCSNLHLCTDDGSIGFKGFVSNHDAMNINISNYNNIYCCGPEVMMKIIAEKAKKNKISCQVSLENYMACGFGACLCCVTPTISGNKTTCKNGPVFYTDELLNF